MSRRVKSSMSWNEAERILNDCHQIYTDTNRGLITIAQSVAVKLLPPKKKITVMVIGNQSAGKSSFINWYIEDYIQKTGAVNKTPGFTFVTNGCKRESFMGNAIFQLYPHLKPLQEVKGVSENVSTEICTSRQKQFSLVTFVDTPGLMDGDLKYPFDVDQAILWLGDVCDLILVFFDPMDQALCKRTLNIVEQLNKLQGDRLRFYLSKADEARSESARQSVMKQIVLELCQRFGLKTCGFDLQSIYIPNPNKPSQYVNHIGEVCSTIQRTINQTVQNTLNSLEKDCELVCDAVTDALNNDRRYYNEKWNTGRLSCVLGLLSFCMLLVSMLILGIFNWDILELVLGPAGAQTLFLYLIPLMRALHGVPVQIQLIICGFFMQLSFILFIMTFLVFRPKPTLSKKQKTQLQEKLEYVQEVVKAKKKKLHEEYHQQRVGNQKTQEVLS